MRSLRGPFGRILAFSRRGAVGRGFGVALLFMAVVAGGGFVLFGNPTTVEAQSYSAYSDPEKATISFVLSDPQNVAEFKDKFGLSDEEVDKVLAAIRRENQTLSQVQGESQQIIESNEGQPTEQVSAEIEASGYDQKAKRAIARTKAVVKRLLPADQRPEFGAWVDKKWLQASRQASEESATAEGATATASGMWFKVFATQYNGYTNYEVAMPHRSLKIAGGYRVYLSKNGYEAWAPVKEVGPWNTYDNWWDRPGQRTMWKDLRRGTPEAQAAYYSNYNRGRDEFGRKVLNPAGIDLTPAAAAKLGLKKYQNAWIWVWVPWVS